MPEHFDTLYRWIGDLFGLLWWSFTEAPTDPLVPIWWLRNSRYLIIGLGVIFGASFAVRHWGLRILVSARRARLTFQESTSRRARKSIRERAISFGVRFLGNTALVAGTLVVLVLLVATFRPHMIAPYTPSERGQLLQTVNGNLRAAPFPPSVRYPLGTDSQVRDLFSRIIYGTARTLEITIGITLLRLLIGGFSGAVAGWKRGALGQQILSLSAVSSSIPSLLFAYLVIIAIGPRQGFGVFLLALGLTGWAELTNVVNGTVRWIRSQPYIEGATAIGSTPAQLIRRHLLPGLAPQLLPAAALELSSAMLMLAELGFLGIFLGEAPSGFIPQEVREVNLPEWAGMLSGTRLALFNNAWVPLGPAMAFMFAILGFNLLAIGVRGWIDPNRAQLG